MMNNRFDILVTKKLTGQLTEPERVELEGLLDNPELKEEYAELVQLWDMTSVYKADSLFDADKAYKDHLAQLSTSKRSYVRPLAAVVILLLVSLFGFQFFFGNTNLSSGEFVEVVKLPDNTLVTLAPHSTISFDDDFGTSNRDIELKGKAFFDVFHNPEKPFVVSKEDVQVTVLGTKFEINESDVAVKYGKVLVSDVKDNEQILSIGQKASMFNINNVSEVNAEYFKWTNDKLVFEDVSFITVLNDLENHFDIIFKYNDKRDYSNCKFTSKSLVNIDLESILSILESTFECNIAFNSNDNTYVVKNVRCR